jgi:hypothetical protein
MKKLSEIYKELGIDFTFPIVVKDKNGNPTYCEDIFGYWYRREYDKNGKETYCDDIDGSWERREYDEDGNQTYYEDSDGYWYLCEYDEDGNRTYSEHSYGTKQGTKRSSCSGKVIKIDGKKYKLIEL